LLLAHPLLIRQPMSAKPALRRTATMHGVGPTISQPVLPQLEEPLPLSRRRSVPPRQSAFPFMFELPRTSPVGPLLLLAIVVAGLIAAIAITAR
jgi:hypothetical protein